MIDWAPAFRRGRASAQLGFNPKAGYVADDLDLSTGVALTTNIASSCLGDGAPKNVVSAVAPPRGRWSPGESD